tara:strand:+ start:2363 stop:2623 length:261 start_codon:yes stop_codon:yes gene_type:complete
MTISVIIKKWLLNRMNRGNYIVNSVDIETSLVNYAKEYWDVIHTPSTWSRGWRTFRREGEYRDIDIVDIREKQTNKRYKTWQLGIG